MTSFGKIPSNGRDIDITAGIDVDIWPNKGIDFKLHRGPLYSLRHIIPQAGYTGLPHNMI